MPAQLQPTRSLMQERILHGECAQAFAHRHELGTLGFFDPHETPVDGVKQRTVLFAAELPRSRDRNDGRSEYWIPTVAQSPPVRYSSVSATT